MAKNVAKTLRMAISNGIASIPILDGCPRSQGIQASKGSRKHSVPYAMAWADNVSASIQMIFEDHRNTPGIIIFLLITYMLTKNSVTMSAEGSAGRTSISSIILSGSDAIKDRIPKQGRTYIHGICSIAAKITGCVKKRMISVLFFLLVCLFIEFFPLTIRKMSSCYIPTPCQYDLPDRYVTIPITILIKK